MGRFMAKDYVTLREEKRGPETVWNMTSVGRCFVEVRRREGDERGLELPHPRRRLGRPDRESRSAGGRRRLAPGGHRRREGPGVRVEILAPRLGERRPRRAHRRFEGDRYVWEGAARDGRSRCSRVRRPTGRATDSSPGGSVWGEGPGQSKSGLDRSAAFSGLSSAVSTVSLAGGIG